MGDKHMENTNISVCGADCSACSCFGKMCAGCNDCAGKVFHVPEGKACPIYECVKNDKGLSDCGKCGAIPCKIWLKTRDPKYSDEEFQQNINLRMEALRNEH